MRSVRHESSITSLSRIPSEAITTLGLMGKFHEILGRPSYGGHPGYEKALFMWVARMLDNARSSRVDTTDAIDIGPTVSMGHVACVPSWTADTIETLQAEEVVDAWVGEKYWLMERSQDANRVSKDLASFMIEVAHPPDWFPSGV